VIEYDSEFMTDQCIREKINAENIFLKDLYEQVITDINNNNEILQHVYECEQ
jgi:hypothetical protein